MEQLSGGGHSEVVRAKMRSSQRKNKKNGTDLVNKLMMQDAMNPVDAHVSEEQEGDHTQEEPRPT